MDCYLLLEEQYMQLSGGLNNKESMNLNELARKIAQKEGLKKQVNIAQIKEILRITLKLLKEYTLDEIVKLFKR